MGPIRRIRDDSFETTFSKTPILVLVLLAGLQLYGSISLTVAGGLISLSPANTNFVNQPIGTTSTPKTVTVSNTGDAAVTINSISFPQDFSGTNNCGSSLAANSTCTINVVFSPTVLGLQTGVISVFDDAAGSPHTANVSGTTNTNFLSANPTSLDFGNQALNTTSLSKSITLTAGFFSLGPLTIVASPDFSRSGNCTSVTFLNPGSGCTLSVTYKPTSLGPKSGTLTISDAAHGTLYTVPLSGTGVDFVLSPTSWSFGDVAIGTTATRAVTVTNNNPSPVNISSISVTGGFSQSNSCSPSLASGASCSIEVTFSPLTSGQTVFGTLTITDDAIGSPHTVALSARGVPLAISPNPLAFGDVLIGTTASSTISVTNTGAASLNISSISNPNGFSRTTTCGTSLASGASCSINVTFSPVTAGAFVTGTISISHNGVGSSPQLVSLVGRGVTNSLTLSRNSMSFEADLVGTISKLQTVTVSNFGTAPISFSGIAASGDFTQSSNCGTTLQPNANCTISVTFSPTTAGTRTGALTIASNATGSPNSVTLNGTGLASLPIPVITSFGLANLKVGHSEVTTLLSGSGFSTLSKVRWDGTDLPTSFSSSGSLFVTIPADRFATMGTFPITVFNPSPGGGISNIVSFVVYGETALTTKDLIYDRTGARIYASVGAASPALANTLTAINPVSGVLGTSAFVGADPGKLAISNDSSSIYIALDGAARVRRFDTASQTPGISFELGNDPTFGAFYAEDIAVAPDEPATIAVSRMIPNVSPRHRGVAIYDGGVARPATTAAVSPGSNVIEFSESPSVLYGHNLEVSSSGLRTMSVDSSGVTLTNVQTDLLIGDFQFVGGRIYTLTGEIIDPVSRTLLGHFVVGASGVRGLAVDSSLHRAFFLFCYKYPSIEAYDLDTFALTGGMSFPEIQPPDGISSLIRWGEAGLAFRTGTQVITFQIPPNLLPTPPTPLSVSKSGTGSGTVISYPLGINCGASCTAGFAASQIVTLTATPSTGSVFIGWSGDIDCISGSVTMYASRSCVARFDLPQSNLTRLRGDFNGDGKSDILWQHTDGRSSSWVMNGVDLSSGAGLLGPGTGWSIKRRADFNADGKTDILWQNNDGSAAAWLMDGINLSGGAVLLGPGTGWSASNVGDFNGDGNTDILWQHTDGSSAIWLMSGLNLLSGAGLLGPGTGWSVSNVGDFNGDSKSDILWRHTDGSVSVWLMNGTNLSSGGGWIGAGTGWTPILIGDFDGDGISDLLWQHPDGSVAMWLVDGLGLKSGAVVLGPGTGWSPKEVGDFNGDGKSDILWQHVDGSVAVWLTDGLGILSGTIIRTANSGYSVNRVGDFDGDGKSDILWQQADGSTVIWLMNGLNTKTIGSLLGAATGWSPAP